MSLIRVMCHISFVHNQSMQLGFLSLGLALALGCGVAEGPRDDKPPETASPAAGSAQHQQTRNAYFGDLHVHTRFSFDAFAVGTRTTPDDAYRFAKGESLRHPAGFEIRLDRPLDFYAVTDHAHYLGMVDAMADPSHPLSQLPEAKRYTEARTVPEAWAALFGSSYVEEHLDRDVLRSAWQRTIEAAERHYEPGKLTTFIGYEYTSAFGGNLHRNVIFRGRAAPEILFSRLDSLNPEKLWAWMDELRGEGIEALAIPHNSNASNGHMFALQTFDGRPLDAAYAETRMRNEPLVEVTQVKGTSEAHPILSPNDEWADFEISPYRTASWLRSKPRGSYVREAYLDGLRLEEGQGFNPYRFGLIGSSDSHSGGGSFDESSFFSKLGLLDASGRLRGSVAVDIDAEEPTYAVTLFTPWAASGLAAVWAEENTRESIYDAFRRKETFATSGPRMRLRFFAGYDLPEDLASRQDPAQAAYAGGVSMGGDLPPRPGRAPRFFAWGQQDPKGAKLQRLQVVKGWMEDGQARERVFDVACSDGLEPDAETQRCPDNGADVDLSDCSPTPTQGADELIEVWEDPDFDETQRAFYYARLLENPTCRWSTWDALHAGSPLRPDLPATIQERAWSSPIWITP